VSPKVKTKVIQGLKFEKDQTKISGAVDNVCATTILVNNIDHTYKSKNIEPNEEYSEDYIVQIPLKINNFEMIAKFRVVDKEDPFYDILIKNFSRL